MTAVKKQKCSSQKGNSDKLPCFFQPSTGRHCPNTIPRSTPSLSKAGGPHLWPPGQLLLLQYSSGSMFTGKVTQLETPQSYRSLLADNLKDNDLSHLPFLLIYVILHSSKVFTHIHISSSERLCKVSTIIIPILQMSKLRHRMVMVI